MNNSTFQSFNQTALALLVTSLLGVCGTAVAQSGETPKNTVAGKTIIAKGTVKAVETSSANERQLRRRSPIFGVDVVKTGDKSKTQLRMTDGGMIALKENSELLISSYEFNKADKTGSVVMELVKGGLRSVTGAIKSDKGNYQLKTPVGSIGIRGTHYEIEIIQGEVFIAVWDGAVDVRVDVGTGGQDVSLGEGEDFSYAKIDETGEVTELLAPPDNFNEGHSSDPATDEEQSEEEQQPEQEGSQGGEGQGEQQGQVGEGQGDQQGQSGEGQGDQQGQSGEGQGNDTGSEPGSETETPETGPGLDELGGDSGSPTGETTGGDPSSGDTPFDGSGADNTPTGDPTNPTGTANTPTEPGTGNGTGTEGPIVDPGTDFDDINPVDLDIAALVAERTGIWEYNLVPSSVNFTKGSGSNFTASLKMNFNLETATIENGQMSFNDNGGEWFAAFNGIVNQGNIEMFVNFASHGNNLAQGEFTTSEFTDGIDGIFNVFSLWERNDVNIAVGGQFKLLTSGQSNPEP